METTPNRRSRRNAMKINKFFKLKNSLSFKERFKFTNDSIKRGKEIFKTNQQKFEKNIKEQLENIENKKIQEWKDNGYNDTEIELLREANAITLVKDLDAWHKEKRQARQLIKDATKTRNNRLFSND